MTDLAQRKCKACEGGVPPLSRPDAERMLLELASGWVLTADGKALRRAFSFKDFYRTMSFVNAIAHIANIEDHHPDLEVGYNYCRVQFTTHAIKGLSENDFICAAKIDEVPLK
ncbi:MAG TPA: 4a-hydroxytetrahydrobiopterin dehydratase [Steroidobacteraceae bacterium]|nr:4a-hydroxytetrahydrobiopterin dehydratase [Steroidobacteraceae bacterium]